MGKLPAFSPSVNLPTSFHARRLRRLVESQALCPWCQGRMYLNRAGDRLQCVNAAQCAGIVEVEKVQVQPKPQAVEIAA